MAITETSPRIDRAPMDGAAVPTRAEVRATIPDECFRRSAPRSLAHLAMSAVAVVVPVWIAAALIPTTWQWLPMWILYALVAGTAATGLWVVAHECGHGAFSDHQKLNDTIGFVLHTALLVPYFAWQRSHAMHHAYTNHLDAGETHVPARVGDGGGADDARLRQRIGAPLFTAVRIVRTLLLGWPAYLVGGATGAPDRRRASHFWPAAPFTSELFPPRWHTKVWLSSASVLAVVAALTTWALTSGSPAQVLALYGGPYLVVNMWLVGYTWLHHTDVDVAHLAEPEWSWVQGAFLTVDRPYGRVIDLLHHSIGSTHVTHHIDHRIPHYRAAQATAAIRDAYPHLYRFDPTPVHAALWRIADGCIAVEETTAGWCFTDLRPTAAAPPADAAQR